MLMPNYIINRRSDNDVTNDAKLNTKHTEVEEIRIYYENEDET